MLIRIVICDSNMRNISFVPIQDIGTVLLSTNGEANVRDTLVRIKSTFPDAPVVISRHEAAAA